jgi:hypothetical protein
VVARNRGEEEEAEDLGWESQTALRLRWSLREELELLVRCGQDLENAEPRPDRPVLCADLILVNGDPAFDITATRNINRIWLAGVLVDREWLLRKANSLQPK